MAGFKMDDYVDVAERIAEFSEKYPDGSLQSELVYTGEGWLCTAFAYRHPEDPRPGIGHAFEPVPGKTPYTKDSEAMNAETSAWGRAIVALGFRTKKIASAQEVKARQSSAKPAEKKPAVPSGDIVKARTRLLELAKQLGAFEATLGSVKKHEGVPDELAWLNRCIKAAEQNLENKAA